MFKKSLNSILVITFFLSSLTSVPKAHANALLGLPEPGTMVSLSPAYTPAMIKGLTIHKDNPFMFDFIVDGQGVEMNVDPAMIERIKHEGIESLTPIIFRITPVASIWPLVGLEPP